MFTTNKNVHFTLKITQNVERILDFVQYHSY